MQIQIPQAPEERPVYVVSVPFLNANNTNSANQRKFCWIINER